MNKKSFLCRMLPLMMAAMLCGIISSCGDDDDPWDGGKKDEVVDTDDNGNNGENGGNDEDDNANDNENVAPWDGSISEVYFPDENFRNYLLEQNYGKDGVITEEEIKSITHLYVSRKDIRSLKGIEYFTELTYLFCDNNQLTSLDISKNTVLRSLSCSYNQLTSLDVTNNTSLSGLSCDNNQLTSIDVSQNTLLVEFYCHNNQLTRLDVSNNTSLGAFYCSSNQIKGEAMDVLVNSLPQKTTPGKPGFYVYDAESNSEGNVCTKAQVAVVNSKGWTPYYYNNNGWREYEGSNE